MINSRCLVLILCCLLPANAYSQQSLKDRYIDSGKNSVYRTVTAAEVSQAEQLFQQLLSGDNVESSRDAWNELGFNLYTYQRADKQIVVVQEIPDRREGRGFYLFSSTGDRLLLQAPHRFNDLLTGKLTLQLYLENDLSAAAFGTVNRYETDVETTEKSDLTHRKNSYFAAFSRAFARRFPNGQVAQIHGFAIENRTSEQATQFDLILSNGTTMATKEIAELGNCIELETSLTVAIYPSDLKELGGTLNQVGKELNKLSLARFLHLEINRSSRELLVAEQTQRGGLIDCLIGGVER